MFPFQRHPLRAGQGRETVLPAPGIVLVKTLATGPAHIVVGPAPHAVGPRADGADRIPRRYPALGGRNREAPLAGRADAAVLAAVLQPFPAARAEARRLRRLRSERLARRRRRPADERLHPEHRAPGQRIQPRRLRPQSGGDEAGVVQANCQCSPAPDDGRLGTAQAGGIHLAAAQSRLWAVGCGLWAVGCGLWAVGCRPWAVGCGL